MLPDALTVTMLFRTVYNICSKLSFIYTVLLTLLCMGQKMDGEKSPMVQCQRVNRSPTLLAHTYGTVEGVLGKGYFVGLLNRN